MFDAILIEKDGDTQTVAIRHLDTGDLPDGDVLVDVAYSTLNYKDALAITGAGPVVRRFPIVPGIDFSGTVRESDHPDFSVGDRVVLNGWGVGETHWGGLSGQARVKGDWLVPLPEGIDLRHAMAIGTAGYTAMLCIMALERHGVTPASGEIVVTGAAGGVGSIAVAVLSKLGFEVAAVTGRASEADYLKSLGAASVIDRSELTGKVRPLASERWAGAIDVVGSTVLANVIASMKYDGVVAACGLAGGLDLPSSVAPFILRGVTLAGVESVMRPKVQRIEAYRRLARDLDMGTLDALTTEVAFDKVIESAPLFLEGKIRGRVVVPIGS